MPTPTSCPAITVKAKGKGKHKQPATSRLGTLLTPASAVYSDSNYQVTLTPRGTLNLTKPEELIVNGALVTDTLGRPIDGNDDGQPGGDNIATISGSQVTVRVTLGASDGTAGHGPSRDRRPARSRRADRVDPLAACTERGPSRGKSTDTRIGKQFFVVVNLSVARRHGQRQPGGNPAQMKRDQLDQRIRAFGVHLMTNEAPPQTDEI